jgi:hypothetical protein
MCTSHQSRAQAEADKTVPLEVAHHVRHDKRGLLSLARTDDPNSGELIGCDTVLVVSHALVMRRLQPHG